MTEGRTTPRCPHTMAPLILTLRWGTNIITRAPPGRKDLSGCCSPQLPPYPSVPKHSTARSDPMEGDPQGSPVPSAAPIPCLSGVDPGASGRPPDLGVLPGAATAVPTHASTHGHLRGLEWQPGGGRALAAQARRDLVPGMPYATSVTPMKDKLAVSALPMPVSTPWGQGHLGSRVHRHYPCLGDTAAVP